MDKSIKPHRGQWYKRQDLNALFEVVALDSDEGTIEIQYFDGEIEELDQASWDLLSINDVAPPEDWSGALEVDSYAINDSPTHSPTNLNDALNLLENSE